MGSRCGASGARSVARSYASHPAKATAPKQRRAIDFIHDTLADGRAFRVLSVVDVFSRSSEVLEAGIGFTGQRVAELLDRAAKGHLPEAITADHGTEFTSKALDAWAFERGVKLDFIRPGKPTETGFVESFQGRFRDECLNAEVFENLDGAGRSALCSWQSLPAGVPPEVAVGGIFEKPVS